MIKEGLKKIDSINEFLIKQGRKITNMHDSVNLVKDRMAEIEKEYRYRHLVL